MKLIILLFLVPLMMFVVGCRSSESVQKSQEQHSDTTRVVLQSLGVPTTIMQNASNVTATVDSIILIDENRFRLFVTILSVEPKGGMASLAESNQKLELRPGYVLTDRGIIDGNDERNKNIMRLRLTHPGDSFAGTISLSMPGGWVLSRVDNISFTH